LPPPGTFVATTTRVHNQPQPVGANNHEKPIPYYLGKRDRTNSSLLQQKHVPKQLVLNRIKEKPIVRIKTLQINLRGAKTMRIQFLIIWTIIISALGFFLMSILSNQMTKRIEQLNNPFTQIERSLELNK